MLAADTLEILEVGCQLYRFAVPFQLPVLEKLTLHGDPDIIQPSRNIEACYPALRCLSLEKFLDFDDTEHDFPDLLNAIAPTLTKVRFMLSYGYQSAMELPQLISKTQIQKILLQAEYGRIVDESWYRGIIGQNSQLRDAVVILKPSKIFTYQPMVARDRWYEVCAGHLDYWEPAENEIDSKALMAATSGS
jgi:hypothetical protein